MTTHNTADKQGEAPERIWVVIGFASEVSQGAIWASFSSEESARGYPGPRMLECAPRQVVEYVRADSRAAPLDSEAKARAIVEEYKQRVIQLPSGDAVPCAKWLEMRLRIALDLASRASVAAVEEDDWVAWLRYDYTNEETTGTTINVCDSDAPGAFKVYRRPAATSSSASAGPPPFMVVTVSEDCREISIEHPNSAGFDQVFRAHVALRDHLNERITQRQNCPFNPSPAEGEVGKVLTTALRGAEQTVAVLNAVGAAPVEPPLTEWRVCNKCGNKREVANADSFLCRYCFGTESTPLQPTGEQESKL